MTKPERICALGFLVGCLFGGLLAYLLAPMPQFAYGVLIGVNGTLGFAVGLKWAIEHDDA
jgi:hypothetical protein